MAKCAFCGREMLKAKGCRKITIRFVDGSRADPIKVGAPGDFYYGCEELNNPNFRCGDCGAMVGGYHHPGCDCERCPKCGAWIADEPEPEEKKKIQHKKKKH